jgi:glutamine synthetase
LELRQRELAMRDPKTVLLNGLEENEVEELGLKDKKPTILDEAIAFLKADEALTEALEPGIVDRYLEI